MPTNEEVWYHQMIEEGYIPDEDGYYHWKSCNEDRNLLDFSEML